MNKEQVKKLFKKYVNNTCTDKEKQVLERYLESFQQKDLNLKDLDFDERIKEKIWADVLSKTSQKKKVSRFPFRRLYKYAAVFICLVSLTYWFLAREKNNQSQDIVVVEQAIILKTGNNKEVVINTSDPQVLYKNGKVIGTHDGESINYSNNETETVLTFNEIKIPNGRTFKLTLSDGTAVHLNAGTTMKYPVTFIQGKQREVYLDGEAYFEVAKDSKHPFIVNANNMGVKVLGTHFNVNTYNDLNPYTVLAEGSVTVYNLELKSGNESQKTIIPGQKASLTNKNIQVEEVDINEYLDWKEGMLIFNNERFLNILAKIERKYNVTIKNEYLELNNLNFKGSFENETIIDLLNTFKVSAGFNYTIIDNEIVISKP